MEDQMYKRDKTTRDFLLSFFQENSGYEKKEVNGFWLVKQLDKLKNLWNVAIYSSQAFAKKKKHEEQFRGKVYKTPRGKRRERG